MLTPASSTTSSSQNLRESALQSIRKNHPLFQLKFSADDWVENHGTWTLTEAAIELAVSGYRDSLESHNAAITTLVSDGERQIAKLQQELTGLMAWDKTKRSEITKTLSGLKSDFRSTKSETVRGDLNSQIGALETQLTTMSTDRDRKKL